MAQNVFLAVRLHICDGCVCVCVCVHVCVCMCVCTCRLASIGGRCHARHTDGLWYEGIIRYISM